jgi:hypothetical protein
LADAEEAILDSSDAFMKQFTSLSTAFLVTLSAVGQMVGISTGPAAPLSTPREWMPAADKVFLQEIGHKVTTSFPITSLALHEGKLYAGSDKGLYHLAGNSLVEVGAVRDPVHRLRTVHGALWAMTSAGLLRFQSNAWQKVTSEQVTDVCEHLNEVVVATEHQLWRVKGDHLEKFSTDECPGSITRVASYCETLYVLGPRQLILLASGTPGSSNNWTWDADKVQDWGALPSTVTRDLLSVGNRLYIATDRGLGVLRGMSLTQIRGAQGLCYEDTTCLANGFAKDIWIGTKRGAIRNTDNQYHYFAGERWLPGDKVNGIAAGDRTVFIATDKGLGIIDYEPYTLLKKADWYEQHLKQWGQKRLGFVHKLEWDEQLKQYVREVGDNDGGYSTDYLVAQCYRYAVTKDPSARAEAVNTFQTIRWLVAMTGISGFPARSVWAKGEMGHKAMHGSGGLPAEWHDTADGKFEWKGDTSSDELCAHFYAVAIFLELAAQGNEIGQAKDLISSMASHLMDHGWKLVDIDGQPTRWGRWDPDYFNNTRDGAADRGLDSLEILSFMKTAETITGNPKFTGGYRQLTNMDYPSFTLRQRKTFPPEDIVPFDDRLAFYAYFNLLKFERDPALRAIYRRSLDRTWEIVRIEQIPWFNFIYGTLTGNECEVDPAVTHLREWPLDLVIYSYQNSHRADLQTPPGYVPYSGGTRAFSPREREPMLWDNWSMKPDGGTDGNDVVQPSSWLMAYWMGRYYGFIEAPQSTDPSVLTVKKNQVKMSGAAPYSGPARPKDF